MSLLWLTECLPYLATWNPDFPPAPSLAQKPKPNAHARDPEQVQLLGQTAESRAKTTHFLSL